MRILIYRSYKVDGSNRQLKHNGTQKDGSGKPIISTAGGRNLISFFIYDGRSRLANQNLTDVSHASAVRYFYSRVVPSTNPPPGRGPLPSPPVLYNFPTRMKQNGESHSRWSKRCEREREISTHTQTQIYNSWVLACTVKSLDPLYASLSVFVISGPSLNSHQTRRFDSTADLSRTFSGKLLFLFSFLQICSR